MNQKSVHVKQEKSTLGEAFKKRLSYSEKAELISKVARGIGDEKEQKTELAQIVVFRLGGEEFCVDIHETREIVQTKEITPIPNTPSFIAGMFNLRGKIVVVIDFHVVFGIPRSREKYVIIAQTTESTIGVLVDDVTGIIKVPKKDIKKAPPVITKKIAEDYLKGVVILKERLLIYLDLLVILSEKELGDLAELSKVYGRKEQILTGKMLVESQPRQDKGIALKEKESKKIPRKGLQKEKKKSGIKKQNNKKSGKRKNSKRKAT